MVANLGLTLPDSSAGPGSPGPAASPVQASRGVGVRVSNGIYDGMSEMVPMDQWIVYNPYE